MTWHVEKGKTLMLWNQVLDFTPRQKEAGLHFEAVTFNQTRA